MKTIQTPSSEYNIVVSWENLDEANRLNNQDGKLTPRPSHNRLTSESRQDPFYDNKLGVKNLEIKILSLYPNPADEFFIIQYNVPSNGNLEMKVIDPNGKTIKNIKTKKIDAV